ncbi:hypothetical protein Tco_0677808 [Tanacetum coccineum]|uniref:AP2/ERF domain-containing protein n=1 Tax=Tanacetum coccineum TaxID=301880 RepID=A0ABQ4XD98_9ASTR
MSDEPLGDDSKPISYDVTFSNPLFDFNDDSTLCNGNPLFDEEFEDINVIIYIDLPLGEPLDILSTGDREINFNPSRDIEELERLLADDPVPIPIVFDDPLGNSDSMSRSSKTSDLFEELIAEIGLDDSIPIRIDDRYYDSEGDILFFEQLLNEDTSSDVSPAMLPKNSTLLVTPPPASKQFSLREVERFDHFFFLTQSVGKTRVMEIPSFGFHHMPSPCPAAYSPKEIPSGESKVHIEVLLVLWGNRLPIPDGSLPLSRYKGLKTKQKRWQVRGTVAGRYEVQTTGTRFGIRANHWFDRYKVLEAYVAAFDWMIREYGSCLIRGNSSGSEAMIGVINKQSFEVVEMCNDQRAPRSGSMSG